GPNVTRFIQLVKKFPQINFSTIADDADAIRAISAAAQDGALRSPELEVLLDIDCGQHRTGVIVGPKAVELYRLIASLPGLKPGGLHVYDGHIHDVDLATRT